MGHGLRPVLATAAMLLLFCAALAWLYLSGRLSMPGIALILLGGIFWVGLTLRLYRRLYSDEDD